MGDKFSILASLIFRINGFSNQLEKLDHNP